MRAPQRVDGSPIPRELANNPRRCMRRGTRPWPDILRLAKTMEWWPYVLSEAPRMTGKWFVWILSEEPPVSDAVREAIEHDRKSSP